MTRRLPVCLFCLVAFNFLPTCLLAQNEGQENYTVTREEWIAVLFNSAYKIDNMATHGYRISYACPPGENTVVILVDHYKDADKVSMEKSIGLARQMINAYARSKGWDGWLRTRERFTVGKEGRRPLGIYTPDEATASKQPPEPDQTAKSPDAAVDEDELKAVIKGVLKDALKEVLSERATKGDGDNE